MHTHTHTHHSSGSGIPEMKTVLRGISLTNYLNFRTFISKSVSTGGTSPSSTQRYESSASDFSGGSHNCRWKQSTYWERGEDLFEAVYVLVPEKAGHDVTV